MGAEHADQRQYAETDDDGFDDDAGRQADGGELVAAEAADDDHVGQPHRHLGEVVQGQRRGDPQQVAEFA